MRATNFQETAAGRHVGLHGEVVASGCSPLAVIEHVEGFEPELKGGLLLDGEVLEESHVEVGAIGSDQRISRYVSESQTSRHGICCGVVLEKRVAAHSDGAGRWNVRSGITDQVRIRSCSSSYFGDASIIAIGAAVGDIEGNAGGEGDDSGPLPSTQSRVYEARLLEERQVVDVADIQQVALVEVGGGAVPCDVVRVYEIRSTVAIRCIVKGVYV